VLRPHNPYYFLIIDTTQQGCQDQTYGNEIVKLNKIQKRQLAKLKTQSL
jgi:hypothetical protein